MIFFTALLVLLAAVAVVATIRTLARDGYRRIPCRGGTENERRVHLTFTVR